MKQRIRAIQICVNLAFTINKMKEIEEEGLINTVSSKSTVFKSTRASKSKLIVVKQDLMKKFKISKEEITG
tara:strand:- start:62 stop:274 length:213 start_codon:yes stop_codon:yes gene_type:complete